jgi:hypothetical protein
VGDRTRTGDNQIHSLTLTGHKPVAPQGTCGEDAPPVARQLHTEAETDPDLAQLIDAWSGLPPHIKAAILALVKSAV